MPITARHHDTHQAPPSTTNYHQKSPFSKLVLLIPLPQPLVILTVDRPSVLRSRSFRGRLNERVSLRTEKNSIAPNSESTSREPATDIDTFSHSPGILSCHSSTPLKSYWCDGTLSSSRGIRRMDHESFQCYPDGLPQVENILRESVRASRCGKWKKARDTESPSRDLISSEKKLGGRRRLESDFTGGRDGGSGGVGDGGDDDDESPIAENIVNNIEKKFGCVFERGIEPFRRHRYVGWLVLLSRPALLPGQAINTIGFAG
ncbi:hypothetical protein WH47_02879 [Habropoda laboriosa]|uniref:Uncharacterized protein n=1 Tax=Habropoda laboriosa TaxID=597456 RepID=A0A0L7RI23_9HYME|nr:hypothetical protein WH47_02879 [Habropoda laboriosa]